MSDAPAAAEPPGTSRSTSATIPPNILRSLDVVATEKGTQPYRCRVRPPSFVNLQSLPQMVEGSLVADLMAVIGTLDIVLGEIDR